MKAPRPYKPISLQKPPLAPAIAGPLGLAPAQDRPSEELGEAVESGLRAQTQASGFRVQGLGFWSI